MLYDHVDCFEWLDRKICGRFLKLNLHPFCFSLSNAPARHLHHRAPRTLHSWLALVLTNVQSTVRFCESFVPEIFPATIRTLPELTKLMQVHHLVPQHCFVF